MYKVKFVLCVSKTYIWNIYKWNINKISEAECGKCFQPPEINFWMKGAGSMSHWFTVVSHLYTAALAVDLRKAETTLGSYYREKSEKIICS